MDEVSFVNIRKLFEEFSQFESHEVGTKSSEDFARNITDIWQRFGLVKVELDEVKVMIPEASKAIPSEIAIKSAIDRKLMWKKDLDTSQVGRVSKDLDLLFSRVTSTLGFRLRIAQVQLERVV